MRKFSHTHRHRHREAWSAREGANGLSVQGNGAISVPALQPMLDTWAARERAAGQGGRFALQVCTVLCVYIFGQYPLTCGCCVYVFLVNTR